MIIILSPWEYCNTSYTPNYRFLKAMVPDPIFGNLPLHVRNMEIMRKLGQDGILERLVEFPINMIVMIADRLKHAPNYTSAIDRHGVAMGEESGMMVQSTLIRLKEMAKILLEPLWQKRCYVRCTLQGKVWVCNSSSFFLLFWEHGSWCIN